MEETYNISEVNSEEIADEATQKVSPLLGGAVVVLILLIFLLIGLIIRTVFFVPAVPRSQLERDLIDARNLVKGDPSNHLAHYDLGVVYSQLGQYSKALDEFNTSLKFKKDFADAHYQIGQIYQKQNDEGAAVSAYEKAVKVNPNYEFAHFQLGMISYENKKYNEAVVSFNKTIKSNKILADPYYYLGMSYEKLGKKKEAIKQYKAALKYWPDYDLALKALKRLQ